MIMDEEAVLNSIGMKVREHYVKKHPYAISFIEDRNLYYTYLPVNGKRQKVCRKSREELEDVICSFQKEQETKGKSTLGTLFPLWVKFKKEEYGITDKTAELYKASWDKYYKGKGIADIPLQSLTPVDIKSFYRKETAGRELTSKRIADMKGIMNGIFAYAVEKGIVAHNTSLDVITRDLPVKQKQNRSDDVYTKEDAEKITAYIEENCDDIYSLAIGLMFCLIVRIGELKALRWEDIDMDRQSVYIHTQIVENKHKPDIPEGELIKQFTNNKRYYTHVAYVKKHSDTGTRMQYLNSRALSFLERIRRLSDGRYLFMKDGRFLITTTFNEHLKDICEKTGVKYHSSHKIRFLNACKCFENTGNLGLTQEALGHSSSEMTFHYLSRNMDRNAMKDMFNSL